MAEIVSGLEFIENQPIVFNRDAPCDECIPDDSCVLVASEDFVEFQIKQNPCDTNLICDTPFALGPELIEDTLMEQYGDDLVTNGSFASGASWALAGAEFTISGGAAHTAPGGSIFISMTQTLAAPVHDQWHRIQFTLSNVINGGQVLRSELYSLVTSYFTDEDSDGVKTSKVRGGNATNDLRFLVEDAGGVDFTSDIDDVSLRVICPLWTLAAVASNWEPLEPGYRHTAGSTTGLGYGGTTIPPGIYACKVTIANATAGGVKFTANGGTDSDYTSGNGTFDLQVISGGSAFLGQGFIPTSNFDGDIMFTSIREITTCFDIDDTWSIDGDGLVCSGGNSSDLTMTGSPILALNYYQVQIEIYNYFSGTIQFEIGTQAGDLLSGNGIHKDYITAATNGQIIIIPSADFVGCFKASTLSVIRLSNALEVDLIDADGNLEAELDGYVTFYEDVINVKFQPSTTLNLIGQPVSMGCKTIRVHNPCEEEIAFFSSEFETGDGWVDGGSGFMTTGGGVMVYECNNPPDAGGTGTSSHVVAATGGYTYRCIITVSSLLGSQCTLQVVINDGSALQSPVTATGDIELLVSPTTDSASITINIAKLAAPSSLLELDSIVVTEIRPIQRSYESNCLKFATEFNCQTKVFEAYSDTNNLGFNFLSGFKLHQRLIVKVQGSHYPEQSNEYTDTGGSTIKPFSRTRKITPIFIEMVPEYTHDFIRAARNAQHFLIDSVEHIAKADDYEPIWDGTGAFPLAPIIFEVYKADKNTLFNFACE